MKSKMTADERQQLITSTFELIEPRLKDFCFGMAASARAYYPQHTVVHRGLNSTRGQIALMETLRFCVPIFWTSARASRLLRTQGSSLRELGWSKEHLEAISIIFVKTLKVFCRRKWTPEAEAAWQETVHQAIDEMMGGELSVTENEAIIRSELVSGEAVSVVNEEKRLFELVDEPKVAPREESESAVEQAPVKSARAVARFKVPPRVERAVVEQRKARTAMRTEIKELVRTEALSVLREAIRDEVKTLIHEEFSSSSSETERTVSSKEATVKIAER